MQEAGQRFDKSETLLSIFSQIHTYQVHIKLYVAERQLKQAVEIGVTGAKVIQIETIAVMRKIDHNALYLIKVFKDGTLGEFKTDTIVSNTIAIDDTVAPLILFDTIVNVTLLLPL